MARSCGLRIGPRRFELVVLDGGAKKHKIVAYAMGDLPRDGDDAVATASSVLREAIKKHGVPRDNVGIAIDTGLAAFRTLKLPFSEPSKIEDVLKFEIESQLPHWNVDDVVADYMIIDSTGDSSEVLITAVPKSDLKEVLDIAEKSGVEVLEAEVETTAMVNAALQADVCKVDTAQVLVHIGEISTSVVVVDGGKVREMRAIHIGALSHELGIPAPVEVEGEPAEGQPAAPVTPVAPQDPEEIALRVDQAIKRIRRELGRTVSAARTAHPIEAVYVCGLELPGLVGSRILDAEVLRLDVFEKDGGQPVEGFGPLVVPYGVALRQLGGGQLRPHLRREELRYAGAFEKVELPLAVVALLAVTFLGVWFIFLTKERHFTEEKLGWWRDSAKNYLVGDLRKGSQGYLVYPSDGVKKYVDKFGPDMLNDDAGRNPYEQLQWVNGQIKSEVKKLEKDLGQDADIAQPQSALVGLSLVLGVLEKEISEANRPSLRKVQSTYTIGRQGKPDFVRVVLDLTFFAEDTVAGSQNYENFQKDVQAQPWLQHLEPSRTTQPLENSKGLFVPGLAIEVDCNKAKVAQ